MTKKNNAAFSTLFGDTPDKSGLKVAVGKDGRLTVQRVAVVEDEPDPLNLEEIEALRESAFQEGVAKGTADAIEAHQQAVASMLEQIGNLIGPMIEAMDATLNALHHDSVHLAFTIASKLAPALIARSPRVEIEALIDQCLTTVKTEPLLVITMHPTMVEALRESLDAQAERRGFTGRLVLAEDAGLIESDLRVEWAGGGADRDMKQVIATIEELISRHIDGGISDSDHDRT